MKQITEEKTIAATKKIDIDKENRLYCVFGRLVKQLICDIDDGACADGDDAYHNYMNGLGAVSFVAWDMILGYDSQEFEDFYEEFWIMISRLGKLLKTDWEKKNGQGEKGTSTRI